MYHPMDLKAVWLANQLPRKNSRASFVRFFSVLVYPCENSLVEAVLAGVVGEGSGGDRALAGERRGGGPGARTANKWQKRPYMGGG